jgi:hypothetical protein
MTRRRTPSTLFPPRAARAFALCATLLAGCAGDAAYQGADLTALYRRVEVAKAGAQGPVPVAIRGTPFPELPRETLAAAVIDALGRAPAFQPMRPTAGDPGPRAVDYRMVLAFGELPSGPEGLCQGPDAPTVSTSPRDAAMSFCIGARMLSSARGRMLRPLRDPPAPALADFLGGLAAELLPLRNPQLEIRSRTCRSALPC